MKIQNNDFGGNVVYPQVKVNDDFFSTTTRV